MVTRSNRVMGVDDWVRTPEEEERLNVLAARAFSSEDAREFLRYLRRITVEHALASSSTDAQLRYREGQRALVGVIEQRIEKGRSK